jgi:hypothetical protein
LARFLDRTGHFQRRSPYGESLLTELDQLLLIYLMKQEGELEDDIQAGRFRDQMFLHAIATQNPKLYFELYEDPDVPEEWERPESPEDLQRMMAELAQVGINLNAAPDARPRPEAVEHHFDVRPATNPWNA